MLPGATLPAARASVLARSLARLAGDYLAAHNQIVLAAGRGLQRAQRQRPADLLDLPAETDT